MKYKASVLALAIGAGFCGPAFAADELSGLGLNDTSGTPMVLENLNGDAAKDLPIPTYLNGGKPVTTTYSSENLSTSSLGTGNNSGKVLVDANGALVTTPPAGLNLGGAAPSGYSWAPLTDNDPTKSYKWVPATYANAKGWSITTQTANSSGQYLYDASGTGSVLSATAACPATHSCSLVKPTDALNASGPVATSLYSVSSDGANSASTYTPVGSNTTRSVNGGVVYSNSQGQYTAIGPDGAVLHGSTLTVTNGVSSTVIHDGDITNTGNTTTAGTTTTGGLVVNGGSTFNGNTTTNGNAVVNGDQTVTGTTTTGGLHVTGQSVFDDAVTVNTTAGTTKVTGGGASFTDTATGGNTTIAGGNVTNSGNTKTSGKTTTGSLAVQGDATVGGALAVAGPISGGSLYTGTFGGNSITGGSAEVGNALTAYGSNLSSLNAWENVAKSQITSLQGRMNKVEGGVALAMASKVPSLDGNERFGLTVNAADFDGTGAIAGGIAFRLDKNWQINASGGAGFKGGASGGTVGVVAKW